MQRPFGEAVAQIVYNNTVQKPCVVKLDFIPRDLKDKVDRFVERNIRPMHINFNFDEFEDEFDDGKDRALNSVSDYTIEDLPSEPGDYEDEFQGLNR